MKKIMDPGVSLQGTWEQLHDCLLLCLHPQELSIEKVSDKKASRGTPTAWHTRLLEQAGGFLDIVSAKQISYDIVHFL